jgi:glutathione S-transferase
MTLYDSPVICEYLDTLSGGKMLPASGKKRWMVLRQQALADGVLDAGVVTRYELLRPKEFQFADWMDGQLRKIRGAVSALESECAHGGLIDVLGDAVPTLGQVAVGCALGYLDFRYDSENWRDGHARLAAWYELFAKRRSMTETAPKDL